MEFLIWTSLCFSILALGLHVTPLAKLRQAKPVRRRATGLIKGGTRQNHRKDEVAPASLG